ncbi:MAG: serine/threonine-protein kinase [Nannocystaceae bacterium]
MTETARTPGTGAPPHREAHPSSEPLVTPSTGEYPRLGERSGADSSERRDSGQLDADTEVAHVKRYRVLERIGEGGMGRIYRAHDPVLRRDVALKVMKPNVPQNERDRFRREALYGARFSYPAIVRVYDFVEETSSHSCWFSMEYLPGRDMEEILARVETSGRMIPVPLIADVFRQVLSALQYSHDCEIVHRDVKPSNMFVTRDRNTRFVTAKLLDFGVALDLHRDPPADRLVGDPGYIAPEQTFTGARIDGRADIYAAGMSLYRVITGRHPFEDLLEAPTRELLEAQRERRPPTLSGFLADDTPEQLALGLDDVFERATAKNRNDRYPCAAEMKRHLLAVFRSATPDQPPPDPQDSSALRG